MTISKNTILGINFGVFVCLFTGLGFFFWNTSKNCGKNCLKNIYNDVYEYQSMDYFNTNLFKYILGDVCEFLR